MVVYGGKGDHLFGGGGRSNVVWTSHDSTGLPVVEVGVLPFFVPFFPGALIHGTGGGGTVEIARPMPAEVL